MSIYNVVILIALHVCYLLTASIKCKHILFKATMVIEPRLVTLGTTVGLLGLLLNNLQDTKI